MDKERTTSKIVNDISQMFRVWAEMGRDAPSKYWVRKIPFEKRLKMYRKYVVSGIKKYHKWLNKEIKKLQKRK